jgi:hypothetical protein
MRSNIDDANNLAVRSFPNRIADAIRQDPIVWAFAALLGVACLALAGRYDTFRNELYFIVCGRHPAFGYVDLPPLVALIAAATQLFGDHTWLLRVPAIAATVALIPLTAVFARTLGGNRSAAWMAGVAVGFAPVLVAFATTLETSTFEPITWTACAYLLARAVIKDDHRALLWAGVIAGVALEAKYGIGIWLIALAIGTVATTARRIVSRRELWYGALACLLIGAPSLIWQALHGWPFFVMIHYATTKKNLTGGPLRFEIGQILAMNFVLAPLWIAGVVAPFVSARLRNARFLAIAFVAATVLVIASHGKDYYLTPAYPTMFAAGAVACEGVRRWLRVAWFAGAAALLLPVVPVILPILDPPALARYLDATKLRPRPNELTAIGAPLTQIFSDELGWRQMEQQVAAVYRSLPPEDRARAAIMTIDYGEAAAIDVYGRADGLPPALCGQAQYFLWGTHGYDGSVVIDVNGNLERWQQICDKAEIAGTIGAPYVMPYENERPIILCHGMRRPLPEIWDSFRRYQ